jgi:hypothetical protein
MHCSKTASLDDPVGELLELRWNVDAKRLGGININPQFDLRRLLQKPTSQSKQGLRQHHIHGTHLPVEDPSTASKADHIRPHMKR